MKVVTCISDPERWWYRNILEPSCRQHKLELVPLITEGPWITHRTKDFMLLDYLGKIDPNEIILFTDGYDTLFLSGEEEILRKFTSFDKPLVFTAEKNCWPDKRLKNLYPFSPTRSRYLNSGGFIGYAWKILELLKRYEHPPFHHFKRRDFFWELQKSIFRREFNPAKKYYFSNQYYWARVFLHNQDAIALDYHSEIFLELTAPWKVYSPKVPVDQDSDEIIALKEAQKQRILKIYGIRNNRFFNRRSGAEPCQLHFNGTLVKSLISDPDFAGLTIWQSGVERRTNQNNLHHDYRQEE